MPYENRSHCQAPIPCKFEELITALQSIPPLQLATQLTLIEWRAFENFNPREVFYFWTDEAGTKAKSLVRIDKQSQYLTNLVNSEFIQLTKDTKRLEFVKYMWNVARVIYFELVGNLVNLCKSRNVKSCKISILCIQYAKYLIVCLKLGT